MKGFVLGTSNPPKTERNEQINQMRSEGMTLQAIGKAFGISHQRVSEIVKGKKK